MNQTKIYAIFLTVILLIWWPAGYFYITQDLTTLIQEKDQKIDKALKTLKKAKASIEKKDETIKSQSGAIQTCNENLVKKDEEIISLKADLEAAYSWISEDAISTEWVKVVKKSSKVWTWTGEELVQKECPVCEKCENKNVSQQWWWKKFNEMIILSAMDLAYNERLWKHWLPYLIWQSKSLLEMYNWDNETLKAKVIHYCPDDYIKKGFLWKREKAIITSYQRAYCEDEKYENCPAEIKKKIDSLKEEKNILWSQVIRVITKYDEENPSNVSQELFAVYNDFWQKICSWIRNTSKSWKQSYIRIR